MKWKKKEKETKPNKVKKVRTMKVGTHKKSVIALWLVLIFAFLLMIISGMFSSCSAMLEGGLVSILGTSFTAEDEDIIGANEDYRTLEEELRRQLDRIETDHPG